MSSTDSDNDENEARRNWRAANRREVYSDDEDENEIVTRLSSSSEDENMLEDGNNKGEDNNNDEEDGDNDGAEDEENVEPDVDDDNSGDVSPEILDGMSDGEEQAPRRARRPRPRPTTCGQCYQTKKSWAKEVDDLKKEHETIHKELKAENTQLKEEIARLNLRGRITWNPWEERLSNTLNGFRDVEPEDNEDITYRGYKKIYLDSCRQGNMSTCLNITHPQLYLHDTPCTLTEIQNHFRNQMISDRYNGLEDLEGIHRHIRSIIFPLRCTRLTPLRFLENAPFSFERLPVSIQFRIWKKLIPSGELVHCLSRLDPCTPPFDCKPEKVFFPSRFDFGNADCCVATADKPSRYLDYLLVSKRWNYATAHLFYATNTFAFSSLGEFGRFCSGIGKARVGRLVNVELMWQGSLTPRQKKGVSLRKQPLAWFMHTSRLRTLAIHINESDKSRMRRPYEMLDENDYLKDFAADDIDEDTLDIFGMEARRTALQPNYRKNRSMRTVQGMDFIYQLRGMKWVRFYDTNSSGRCLIRDWSFSQDIGNVVRREKTNVATFKAEIQNLEPLTGLTIFHPDDETMGFVARFYDDTLIEDTSINGSETSSSSSGYSSPGGYLTSSGSSDSGNSSSSGDSARSASRSSTVESDVEVIDSDVEMGDANNAPEDIDQEPQDIDIADYLSSSSRSSRSNSIVSDGSEYDTGFDTTVTPQPHIIIIEDGDANDKKRRRPCGGGETSSDSGLFVREGSCSAPSGSDSDDKQYVGRKSTTYIDLTTIDEEEAEDGENGKEERSFNDGEDTGKSIKPERSRSSTPSFWHDSSDDPETNVPQKRCGGKRCPD